MWKPSKLTVVLLVVAASRSACRAEEGLKSVSLQSTVTDVQPMTGITYWTTSAKADSPIQLEFCYLKYNQIVDENGDYDWSALENVLDEVASRKHQLVLRWHDTYVGKLTGIPACVTKLPEYEGVTGKSENKNTEFPDWSHPGLRKFVLDFFDRFIAKYDRDARIAFVQVGFGLWAEYHIYDGPMKLGKTFPSKEFQSKFARYLDKRFKETPWMISIDAADGERAPYADSEELRALRFGLFDDSFNHADHAKWNDPNYETLGRDRWKTSPGGGEFAFYKKADQKKALAKNGPYGISFEDQAAKYHISFILGDHQPKYQTAERIREAGTACGYRFRVTRFLTSPSRSVVEIENTGIAPIYYDAFPAVNGVRSEGSLKGLLSGKKVSFKIAAGGDEPSLAIECDRLVDGQKIEYNADLP